MRVAAVTEMIATVPRRMAVLEASTKATKILEAPAGLGSFKYVMIWQPTDVNRRSARSAEIDNTGVGETSVLKAVYFESNDAETAYHANRSPALYAEASSFRPRAKPSWRVVGQLEVGVTGCDEADLPLLILLEPFEIRKISKTDIFRPVPLTYPEPGLLIASPREATHDGDRCSALDAKPSRNKTDATLEVRLRCVGRDSV
jgi:hypothetical protein